MKIILKIENEILLEGNGNNMSGNHGHVTQTQMIQFIWQLSHSLL